MNNEAILLGHYGDDHRVCISAWQSTGHELGIGDLSKFPVEERVERLFIETVKHKKKPPHDLLMMLGNAEHHTPFEKIVLDFQLTTDIATHIHIIKHRIASVNTESARYKELPDKWYLPDDWGNTTFRDTDYECDQLCRVMDDIATHQGSRIEDYQDLLNVFNKLGHDLYHITLHDLTPQLGRKRAKETARFFLPYNKQLTYDLMINMRSFANMVKLRADSAAQLEVQRVVKSMLQQVYGQHFCDWSLQALGLMEYLPNGEQKSN